MGGLPCAAKVISNYAVLAPEATALATPGSQSQQEAAALSQAAMACCKAYVLAYDDEYIGDDGRAKLRYVLRVEGAEAVAFATRLRALRLNGKAISVQRQDPAEVIRDHRDKMVGMFVKVIDELMAEYYKPEPQNTEGERP